MPSYLLETYVPRAHQGELARAAARARDTALRLEADGRRVRYVRSTFLPSDEVGYLVFEAESADAVGEVASRAAIAYERIVEAIERTAETNEER
jgi:hypothetical protein